MKKTYLLIITIITMLLASAANAQTLNWASIQEHQKHIVNINVGWDYAASLGLGYAYKLNTKIPSALSAQFSLPAGNDLLDDFKSKLGYQARVFQKGNFMATAMAYGVFRRYQSDYVKLENFGGEFVAVAGYYKPKWFVAGEFGFDKAVSTHIKNSDVMKQNYPGARDGWYVPTGGNFQYGIQAGLAIKTVDVFLKAGKTADQRFKSTATVPFYFQLGVNTRF